MARTQPAPITESMIHPNGPNKWLVDSRSHKGEQHRVNWVGTQYICTCENFRAWKGRKTCPHGQAVSDLMEAKRGQERMLEMAGVIEPARRKLTLEELYTDVA